MKNKMNCDPIGFPYSCAQCRILLECDCDCKMLGESFHWDTVCETLKILN